MPWSRFELPFSIFATKELLDLGGSEDVFLFYRKVLQMLTWQRSDCRENNTFRWMLKCPFYLPYLNELVGTFPDATFVWTHRHPADCIPSVCSLFEALMHTVLEESSVDRKALGAAVLEHSRLSVERAQQSIEALGNKLSIIHVDFKDSTRNAKNVCRRVAEQVSASICDYVCSCLCVLVSLMIVCLLVILMIVYQLDSQLMLHYIMYVMNVFT